MMRGLGGETYDAAVFAYEEGDWDAGAVNDGLGIADNERFWVYGALAVFGSK
jgi:hypothetical protein